MLLLFCLRWNQSTNCILPVDWNGRFSSWFENTSEYTRSLQNCIWFTTDISTIHLFWFPENQRQCGCLLLSFFTTDSTLPIFNNHSFLFLFVNYSVVFETCKIYDVACCLFFTYHYNIYFCAIISAHNKSWHPKKILHVIFNYCWSFFFPRLFRSYQLTLAA